MTTSHASGVTLRDVFRVIFRHRRKCLLFFLTVMVCATGWMFVTKRAYRSEGKLFVRLGRENVTVDPTATAGQSTISAMPQARETEITSVLEILQSRSVSEAVVDKLTPAVILELRPANRPASPDAKECLSDASAAAETPVAEKVDASDPHSERERAIQQMLKYSEINAVKKSNVIGIAYEAHCPETAQAIVAALIDACQDQHIHANRAPGSFQFLTEQTEQLKSHLNDLENQIRDVKTKTGLTSPVDQRFILVQRAGKLEDELLTTTSALAAAEAQVREMKQSAAAVPPDTTARTTGMPNNASDAMRSQLYGLQLKEKELASKYRDQHPDVIAVRQQIKDAEAIFAAQETARIQETKGPNHVYEAAHSAILAQEPILSSLRAKAEILQTQVADSKAALKSLNESEVQLARLQRELELDDAKYRKYSENVEQARLDQALETGRISNLSVVEAATLDPLPIRPRKAATLGICFVVALLGSICLALVCEFFDHSIKTPDELARRLEIPTLVSVPQLKSQDVALFRGRIRT